MKPSSRVPQDSAGRPAFYHTIGGVGHGFHQHEVRPLVLGQVGEGDQCWVLPSGKCNFWGDKPWKWGINGFWGTRGTLFFGDPQISAKGKNKMVRECLDVFDPLVCYVDDCLIGSGTFSNHFVATRNCGSVCDVCQPFMWTSQFDCRWTVERGFCMVPLAIFSAFKFLTCSNRFNMFYVWRSLSGGFFTWGIPKTMGFNPKRI